MSETIYVYLKDEAVDAWAPVDAEHLEGEGDIYRILDCRGEDAAVEFGKGALVRCRMRRFHDSDGMTAYALVGREQ